MMYPLPAWIRLPVLCLLLTCLGPAWAALTPEEATLMMLGIYEDTGRLLFPTTTQEDYLAAAWLLGQGANLNVVAESVSLELTGQQVDLLNILLKNLKRTSGFSMSRTMCARPAISAM